MADTTVGGNVTVRWGTVWALVGLGVLAQISYPLLAGGDRNSVTVVTVVVCGTAAVVHAAVTRGLRTALTLVLITAGGGLLVEAVGTAIGIPFGSYDYAGSLGPRLLGVPLVIPLAWTMMAWPAWLVAKRLLPERPVARILVAGWALASWDFFLDPQMVQAGHWAWANPAPALPGVVGIPLTNYAGWTLVAVAMMALLGSATEPAEPRYAVGPVPATSSVDSPMYAFYLWTYFSSITAHLVFLDLPGSAYWGAAAMGLVALPLTAALSRPRVEPAR